MLTGTLEPTNEPYAIAKIAGIKLCESFNRQYGTDFRSVMPTNLYGPGDNFDLEKSHVIPALIRKFHDAKASGAPAVEVWGTGTPRREFLHVDDMAAACVFVMHLEPEAYRRETEPMLSHINVGAGGDVTIARPRQDGRRGRWLYAARSASTPTKPDGTPRKLLDVSRLKALGWVAAIGLKEGLAGTYDWFLRTGP